MSTTPPPSRLNQIRQGLRAGIQAETDKTIENLSLKRPDDQKLITKNPAPFKCSACAETLVNGAKFCPSCGAQQANGEIGAQISARSASTNSNTIRRTDGMSGIVRTGGRSSINNIPSLPRRTGCKALCIGMGNYPDGSDLPWPHKDAEDLSLVLSGLGYEVSTIVNANFLETMQNLIAFTETIQPGDDIVYTYSGHGCGIDTIPNLTALDTNSNDTLINVYKFMINFAKIKRAKSVVIAIDACRGNRFSSNQYSWEEHTESSQIAKKSLGARHSEDEFGFAIIYGTSHDTSAQDSPFSQGIQNGLFTYFFKSEISRPGQSLTEIHRRVQQSVMDLSLSLESVNAGQFQKPTLTNEIAGEYYFYPVT